MCGPPPKNNDVLTTGFSTQFRRHCAQDHPDEDQHFEEQGAARGRSGGIDAWKVVHQMHGMKEFVIQ